MEPLGKFPRVLNGVPRENIEGPPRDFPRAKFEGLNEYLRDIPRGFIHHDKPKALPQIFIIM